MKRAVGIDAPLALEESLSRVKSLNGFLHAVIALDPAAGRRARSLEAEHLERGPRGPLHGVPVLVKDNIDTAGELATTAGSTALAANLAGSDAPVVAALRRAGAVVIGKANLSEWANFRSTRSASGWSALGGLTANPYALDRSAGGSSSGSAAAVAAGLAPMALGTETDGSIICPAALCGCVGLKPTVGLLDTAGVVPISHSQDSVGPIARSVRLVAAMLDALTGDGGYLSATTDGVAGLRVGVVAGLTWGRHERLDAACELGLRALASSGVTLLEDIALAEPEDLATDEATVLVHEFKAGIASYLASHPRAGHGDLASLVAHLRQDPLEMAHFGIELFLQAEQAGGLDEPSYLAALARCRRAGREDGIDSALGGAGLDALALPAYPPAWKADLVNGDPKGLSGASRLPAVAGYPILTVPVGLVAGLPVGLALVAGPRSEARLLRLAAAIEDRLGPLPPPTFTIGAVA